MVIATHPKRKPTAHHKKRTGQHQRQTKHFSKTYWPYLPMIGLAVLANTYIGQQDSISTQASIASTTRLEAWTSLGSWAGIIAALIAAAAAAVFFTRHALIWKQILVKSENAIEHNQKLDIFLVSVALAGFILTRAV